MEEEKKKAYSEVVEILKLIDNEEKIEKIPFEVIELIKNNSDPSYRPNIDTSKPLEEQGLRDETFSIMAWIASKYWGENLTEEQSVTEVIENTSDIEYKSNVVGIEQNIATNVGAQNQNADITSNVGMQNENTEKLNAEAAAYNDMEPQLYEHCENLVNLPMLVSETKWYVKIKQKVIKILKMLFRGIKHTTEELN